MLGSLSGGALLEAWNSANMFTGAIDRYQVLFILSCVLRLGGVFLFVLRVDRDNEARPKDLVRHIFTSLFRPILGR